LGYWLRYVSNHVSHSFAQKVETEGVTVAEWAVMRVLYDTGPLAPSALADQMGLTRGAISKLSDRLLAKSMVTRKDNSADARGHTIALSAAGRKLVPEIAKIADANDARFFGDLSADERRVVERVLKGIVERRGLREIPVS
jgi:DNA-binding MarR family transcriptional regulator